MNVEGAYQHVLTDMFAFVATAIAGAVIMTTGFGEAANRSDEIATGQEAAAIAATAT